MKKILAIVTLVLLSTSALAQHGYYGHRHHGHVRSGSNWVAPLIGGVILGAVITDAARANQPVPQPPVIINNPPVYQTNTFNCLVQVYDPITRTVKNEVMICVNQ